MAQFQRTYRDVISKYSKSKAEASSKPAEPLSSCIVDISSDSDPIPSAYWFSESNIHNHHYSYDRTNATSIVDSAETKQRDPFADLTSDSTRPGILCHLTGHNTVTCDFLTGYYMASSLLAGSRSGNTIYMIGCADKQFLLGVSEYLRHLIGKFLWFGTDPADKQHTNKPHADKPHADNIINGITLPGGNIVNINNLRSIRSQINERVGCKFTMFVCDVNPKKPSILFAALLLALHETDPTSPIIIRLPDNPHTTGDTTASFLLLCVSLLGDVKIFATPWGEKRRYYMIAKGIRQPATAQFTNYLIKYIQYTSAPPTAQIPLFVSKKYITDGIQQQISHLLGSILSISPLTITTIEANELWMEKIMTKTRKQKKQAPSKSPESETSHQKTN